MSIIQPHTDYHEYNYPKIQVKNFKFPQTKSKLSLNDIRLEKKKQLASSSKIHIINSGGSNLRRSFSLLNYKKSSKILNKNENKQVQRQDCQLDLGLNKKLFVNHFAFPQISFSPSQQLQNQTLTSRSNRIVHDIQMTNESSLSFNIKKNNSIVQKQSNRIFQTQRKIIEKGQYYNKNLQKILSSNNIRISKKSVNLQGCKLMLSRRSKLQQNPQELLARKLVWDGKKAKKVDYLQIHKQIIQKSQQIKNQKPQLIKQILTEKNLFYNCHSLGGWMSNDLQIESRSRRKSQLYSQQILLNN